MEESEKEMSRKTLRKLEFIGLAVAIAFIVHACTCKVQAREIAGIPEDAVKMKFTCYCPESCPGKTTASGEPVREGIIAASKDHLGDCALLYLEDGTFLGFYECLDTGGKGVASGKVVDVWTPHLTKAKMLMRVTKGVIYVQWVKRPKG